MSQPDGSHSRRQLLKTSAGAAGLVGLAGCLGGGGGGNGDGSSEYPSLGNYPISGDTAVYGFNVPQTGPYQQEGADQLRAYQLAVQHLNNGGGWVDMWDDLSGDGVNGYQVDYVEGDTATDADTARQSAERMIQRDNVIMYAGGSSSATAIAQQNLAQREKVMYMCALTHSNDTTGTDCTRYGFREMFNAYMTGQALAPIAAEEYGSDLTYYQLYADYTWGQTVQESVRQFFGQEGWTEVDSVPTPLDTEDFSTYLSDVPAEADVLFLDHYGLDLANSLTQAVDQGLDEDYEIIIPLYNEPMAEASGTAINGKLGTADWSAAIDEEYSNAFVEAYQNEYDELPSYLARLAYSGVLLYSAAVERAGTFYPPEVIRELEGYEFDNAGIGAETMRECDHQSMRDVFVVEGDASSDAYYQIYDRSEYPDAVGYACDEGPAAECSLGDYGDE